MSKLENNNIISQAEVLERKAKQLRREVEVNQNNCSHIFGEAKYDPTEKTETYAIHGTNVGSGSDFYPETGHRKVSDPRWSRECPECGKVEYTRKQSETITKKPKF